MAHDYTAMNIETIESWIEDGWKWGIPISMEEYLLAKEGKFNLLLTPNKPVPHHWLLPIQGKKVLGLAAGGAQQMPILSALGAKCTVMDLSAKQLQNEREFAEKAGYSIEIIQSDFTKEFPFEDDSFDMIVNPVSLVYAEELLPIFAECARVLKLGGVVLIGLDNGINFISNDEKEIENRFPFNPLANEDQEKRMLEEGNGYQFSHTLEESIGGLLRNGFVIEDIYEDTNESGRLKELGILSYYALKVRLARKD